MKKSILLSLLLGFLCVSSHGDKVLNVNYTAHLNPFLPVKTGKAVVGLNDSDFWNVYSRDGINGGTQSQGSTLNLKWSDGVSMGADLYVTNAPGAWFTEDPDAMMQSYLYPAGGGNIDSFFYNLPDGAYDVYVYAHGNPPGENANIELRIGGNPVGEKSTSSSTNWDTGGWNEGGQYVVFRDVSINNAQPVSIISKGGISGLAVMNGVQFLQKTPVTNLVDKPLLNIDFGAASNQFLHLKVGPAAVGQTTSDIWNLYSRDGTNGEVLANNTLSNLVWSDSSASLASLSVTNAAGAWYTLNPDPMFESYLYPMGRTGDIEAVLSNLHPGRYDVYVYAHGQPAEENGVIALSTPSIDYGTKQTSSATNWDGAGWAEGHEYVLFTNVQVFTNQSLSIVSKPGESGLSVINGVQLVRVSDDPGTAVDPIVILAQPQSVFVAEGIVPVLNVSATNSLPLSYQWTLNGLDLAGATNSSVSAANEGIYQVRISNGLATVTSDTAQVWRGMLTDKPLLNIDFGAASNQFLHLKVGPAAVGQTTSDIWNLYSRDGTNGEVLANNTLSNLVWSDGSGSIASLSVTNAAGAWYTLNSDPMFESYLYPMGRTGEIGAVLSNLHPGTYDVYIYAHGQPAEENGVIALSTPGIDYGTKQTSSATNWDGVGWTEGHEYVLFTNVQVFTNQWLSIVSKPGESGLSVINGVQLVRVSDDPGTAVDPIVILTQPQSVFVAEGIVPVLTVSATNSLPLSYQWTFNGSDLAGATNSSVSAANEGIYQVRISNNLTTVTSDTAQVWRGMLTDKPLLNIDFGAASNQFLHLKVGPAAVGQTTSDIWNLYSRDGTNGTWLNNNQLLNLVWSDGATSVISLSLTNAAGAWYTLNPDPMFESYLYPASHSGNVEGEIKGLPSGVYSIYIYAHGQIPQENGVVQLSTESHQYGMRITSTDTNWDSAGWHRGDEYVLFENVQIFAGESLFISSKPGLSGLAVLNGLQAIQNSPNPAAIQDSQLITILKHPESLIAPLGSTAVFEVVATNVIQLQYQWFYNAAILSGQTNSTLVISNVTDASVGIYQVLVSSSTDAVLSVEAQLTVGEAVSHPLLNVDFGSAGNPYFHTKTGPAAVGLSSTDFWNLYSRDDENGGWVSNGELSNLKWSDSTPSGIQLSVTNAAGAWFTLNTDPMFESYLYPLGRVGDIGAFLTKVPSGNYDLYVYAHGQLAEENAGVALKVGTNVLGTNYTSSSADWDSAAWHEGNQFVRFKNVQVHDNDLVSVVIKPGQSGLAVINGMQLVLNSGDVQPYSPVVADWTFEEGTPGTVMQVVKDWSGKGHDGVGILGQPQFVQSGPGAEGLVSGFFPSGNGGFGSGFRAQDSVDFNLGSEFTIEASINPGLDNNEANRGILVGQDAASGRLVYALDYRSETRTVDFAIISANGDGLFVPAVLPDDGRSHHIAGVFGGQEIRIYLDGVLAASKPCPITPGIAPGGAARVTVGANDIGGYWFNGTLDRVRITAQALSPTEFFSESSQSNILGIVQGPADLTVAAGGTATFNVLAVGPQPLSYQWTFNTNNIPGATNSTLIITNVQSGDAGVYEVIVMSGTNHMQASALLTISDLNTPPVILQQPFSQTNYVGSSAQFSVVAEGSEPLTYLWSFNGSLLTLGTNNTLVITNLDLGDAGSYSVLVTNNYGSVTSRVAYLSVVQPDLSVPQITIFSPESGTTTNEIVTVTGSVTDDVGVVRFEWFKNGQLVGPLPVTNGTFTLPNVALLKGQNVLRFQAFDAAGNMGSATVYLNLEASRLLIISPVDSVQEGAPVTLPIYVKSAGDIGAITFTLNYDSRFLSNPTLEFRKNQVGVFTQVNYSSSNQVRATFALPGQTIAAGSNLIATVSFLTRSVPQDTTVPLNLELQGVFNEAGDPITSGTEVKSTSLWIRERNFIGDNNANDRLDVGDASIIMRLVSLLDPVRPWDVTGNDLNATGSLDAGDIIRVLRTVIHIDPQPGETNSHSLKASQLSAAIAPVEASVADAVLSLTADKSRVASGEKVTFKVDLTNVKVPIAGASFKLDYPANALRFESGNSIVAGPLVSADTVSMWNLSPAQNDFDAQDGKLTVAFSSPSTWGTNSGTLAEFTFTAQAGISDQYRWPVTVSAFEYSDGHGVSTLNSVQSSVTGRDPVAATLGVVNFNPQNGGFQLQVQGELGAQYRIEVSEDLKTWNELGVQVNQTGSLNVSDPASTQSAHRYYRVTQID